MNATTETNATHVKEGQVVIFVRQYGKRPGTANIDKVTKAGWLRLADQEFAGLMFRPCPHYAGHYECKGIAKVYAPTADDFSARLAALNADADQREANEKAKREQQKAHRDVIASRHAAEVDEVKMLGALMSLVRSREVLPDGSRLYRLDLPVKAQYVERKGGFEIVLVRCKDVKQTEWQASRLAVDAGAYIEVTKVEAHTTSLNAGTTSFPSCSGARHANDEEALWEAARSAYCSW